MSTHIIKELEQALSSCINVEESESIDHIFIVGGGSLAAQLSIHLQKQTKITTQVLSIPNSTSLNAPKSFSKNYLFKKHIFLTTLRRNGPARKKM